MNKKLFAFVIMLVFLIVGFSGCTEEEETVEQGKIVFTYTGNIYTINPDGSNEKFLTQGVNPFFSPDGTKIAFYRYNYSHGVPQNGGMYVIDDNGKNEIFLLDYGGYCDWSSDSKKILYTGGDGLYQIDINGETKEKIIDENNISCATFSPNGNKIAYIKKEYEPYQGSRGELYTVNIDGTDKTKLVEDEIDMEHYGYNKIDLWSPDGSKIAYIDGTILNVVNVDGINKIIIGSGYKPSWSPNGNKIAIYMSDGLYVMNPDGTEKTLVEQLGSFGYAGPARWSPDGNHIVCSVGESYSLKISKIDGSESKKIGTGFNPDWGI